MRATRASRPGSRLCRKRRTVTFDSWTNWTTSRARLQGPRTSRGGHRAGEPIAHCGGGQPLLPNTCPAQPRRRKRHAQHWLRTSPQQLPHVDAQHLPGAGGEHAHWDTRPGLRFRPSERIVASPQQPRRKSPRRSDEPHDGATRTNLKGARSGRGERRKEAANTIPRTRAGSDAASKTSWSELAGAKAALAAARRDRRDVCAGCRP